MEFGVTLKTPPYPSNRWLPTAWMTLSLKLTEETMTVGWLLLATPVAVSQP